MIELHRVSTVYGSVPMLREVTLSVSEGEFVCALGPNGAGKSTMFRAITALVRIVSGTLTIMGREVQNLKTENIAALGVGLVPEGRRLFPQLTVRENLKIGYGAVGGTAGLDKRLADMADLFPWMRDRLSQAAGTLSGGEQAMVALARALIGTPRLIIMDEPSLGLSPRLIDEYFKITSEINRRGTTVLLIEQNAEMCLRIAHRGYFLVKGRIVAAGSAADLMQSDEARRLYL
jgi:branched-chain amino acid transport system ATP-binding protein